MTVGYVAAPAPGTITAARVIGWIQAGLAVLGTVIVIIGTIAFAQLAHDLDNETDSTFDAFTDAAKGVLIVLIVVMIGLTAAIMIPLIRLRAGRPGAATGLVVVESILAVLDLIGLVNENGSPLAGLLVLASAVAMIVLLCVPSSRTWLRTGAVAVAGPYPHPGGYPAFPAPPAGQWAADPSGRHQQRFHDGTMWTPWVSDHGATGQDPL